ncbi:cysteine hydrolase [uncultured Paracoccus sp.]|uniref:cysteine hydrolase family protein n=1 Tax=uncultured Paracoccus sp. TaxID=189685 RepID=UPI0025E98727|nr:cysteine hydrolase [uncultured Paracoccus sp.]
MTATAPTTGIRFGSPGAEAVHLCVDMQRLFGPGSPWAVPWMEKVLPAVAELAAAHAARTIFTRFIPPADGDAAFGSWARYYAAWPQMLRDRLPAEWLELAPPLARHVPPARVFDKPLYSPWHDGGLDGFLRKAGISTLIVTGGETEVCVLATVLGAIDRGYRVILVADAVCSSADPGHDAAMRIYDTRFGQQIETAPLAELLDRWRA